MITHAYRVITVRGEQALLCLRCDRLSFNLHDITFHYCGHCHMWLDDLPEDYRRPSAQFRVQEEVP